MRHGFCRWQSLLKGSTKVLISDPSLIHIRSWLKGISAMNYYEILGVPGNASGNTIRTAYRRLVRRYHPDISGSGSVDKFRQVQEAYETLGESSRRNAYDLTLHRPSRPISVTVIRSTRAPVNAEPLASRRIDVRSGAFLEMDEIFDQFLRWFQADWF
jgi:DnaJ-class molecular chaperone